MTPIYKKIYDLNKHEAKLIRDIIYSSISLINRNERVLKNRIKAKISSIEWAEYPSVFRSSDYVLSFQYNNVLVVCKINGYVVAEVCRGANLLSNGEYIRTASLIFREYRSERSLTGLFDSRVFINYTLEYDPLIRDIKEGSINGALLKATEIYNKREVY